jgi:hypothetical protein
MHRNEIQSWSAETNDLPTWRDGLRGSDRTYMIVAVPKQSRKGYQSVVFGRFNGTSGKVKFYPTPEALGIDRRNLMTMGMTEPLERSNEPYVRYRATLEQMKQLLTGLEPEVWAICPVEQLHEALTKGLGRDSSLERAPRDHLHQLKDPPKAEAVTDTGGIQLEPPTAPVSDQEPG